MSDFDFIFSSISAYNFYIIGGFYSRIIIIDENTEELESLPAKINKGQRTLYVLFEFMLFFFI